MLSLRAFNLPQPGCCRAAGLISFPGKRLAVRGARVPRFPKFDFDHGEPLFLRVLEYQPRDVFVVGYGLDYNDEYRHLPYVAALAEHER